MLRKNNGIAGELDPLLSSQSRDLDLVDLPFTLIDKTLTAINTDAQVLSQACFYCSSLNITTKHYADARYQAMCFVPSSLH